MAVEAEQAARGRKPKQAARRRASERALIEAALAIAAEQGAGAVTFEAIGARAGYSRGLATQHFGSKLGLIRAVIAHLHDVMDESARHVIENKNVPGLDALKDYIAAYFGSFRGSAERRAYFIFLAGAVAERGETLALFVDSHDRVKRILIALARRGLADGSIAPGTDAEAAALAAGTLLMGVSVQYLIDPALDLALMERQAKAMVEAGFRAA